MKSTPKTRRNLWLALAATFPLIFSALAATQAADPTFVGRLAYAVDDEGSKRLGLSDEAKQKLIELIDRREGEALNVALELRDLPQAEREARLAPFVAESERMGMALLTTEQRQILSQMGVARVGMSSLADNAIAKMLDLTEEQQKQVGELLAQRAESLAKGGENERRAVMQDYERKLAGVLNEVQRANWDRLAGLAEGELQAMTPAPTQVAETPKDEPAKEPAPTPAAEPKPAPPVAGDDYPNPAVADTKPEKAVPVASKPADIKLKFNFVHQPWSDVLTWFADEADLSLLMEVPPDGTFNYRDTRAYTPAEAIDLMNRVLLLKGFTLVRSDRLLTLMNLEDEIPPQLVEFVSIDELDKRGSFEIVKVLFHLAKMDPADAETEIGKMIGPQGKVIAFPTASQILVTETAGKLRTIREMIEQVENPDAARAQGIVEINLKHVGPEEVMAIARPLLSIPEEENSNDKIRIAIDPFTARLFATGDRELIRQLEAIVPMVDRVAQQGEGATVGVLEQPQLMTYAIRKADPDQVLQILQTLLAGLPDVRLTIDPVTKKVVALARPTEHATIVATLKQLEGDADQIEVIQLYKMDPQMVILSINKLFGMGGEEAAADGPKIDGDPTTMKLWVRGSSAQIEQVKELVAKLEGPQAEGAGLRENIRMLPLNSTAAASALESMELFWPTMRDNKIRIVTPSAISSTLRERRLATPSPSEQPAPPMPAPREEPAPEAEPQPDLKEQTPTRGNAQRTGSGRFSFAHLQQADQETASPSEQGSGTAAHGGDIIVSITPNGLMIASDDLDALDDFETLLRSFTEQSSLMGSEPTVYWLKYIKADVAAETLNQVVNGASASDGGGSLLGDVASSMLGDIGGGMLGSILGGSSTTLSAGAASIVPDKRLNALIIQAAPTDLALIERILPVIDREAGPEQVLTEGTPRLIPVQYMAADQMATIVKTIYPDRVVGASGGGGGQQQRQPSPADFIQALRGGGGGGGGRGGSAQVEAEPAKMTIGVDARSNSLIVAAPEPLFREVEMLVKQLDQEGLESDDAMDVVAIRHGNPTSVQAALAALIGQNLKTSGTSATPSSSSSSSSSSPGQPSGGTSGDAAAIQQRIEFFRALQGGGGGSGGTPGGFGGRGSFGGGTPGGGGGGRPSGGRGGR
ncbi:MAG: general secretion pathway protein [Planctomycetaceae bacterium]|nr:general secretion pathway protein [Planctomycetaceae bacterium]